MRFQELDISGVWLIEHGLSEDPRGSLERVFDETMFTQHGVQVSIEHSLISRNPRCGTLRGFHYQSEPYLEAKSITCLAGSIYDVVVDLRIDSPTFCEWVAVDLHANGHSTLHVPRGCANAWLTTADDTHLHYLMATPFSPEHGRGFRFDDPAFAVRWPASPSVIGSKDLAWPPFDRSSDGLRI